MAQAVKLDDLGEKYRVETTSNPRIPYYLHGPRGALYGLMRQVEDNGQPKMGEPMFAISAKTGRVRRLMPWGTEWVEDTVHLQDPRATDGNGLCGATGRTMSHHEIKRGRISCGACLIEHAYQKSTGERSGKST